MTGYCMDGEALYEIVEFIKKPDGRDFAELLQDCADSVCRGIIDDMKYLNTDEYIAEHIEYNGFEFTADGTRY
jgi:hypothetical protein